jgi:hypothetical protein
MNAALPQLQRRPTPRAGLGAVPFVRLPVEAEADDEAKCEQRWLDWILRPRSIETWPEYQDLITPPKYPSEAG